MPKRKARLQFGGRYDIRELALRVEKMRIQRGVEVKAVASELGIDKADWSRKVRCNRSSFSLFELGRLADIFRAPTGWPFVPEEIGALLERLMEGRK